MGPVTFLKNNDNNNIFLLISHRDEVEKKVSFLECEEMS